MKNRITKKLRATLLVYYLIPIALLLVSSAFFFYTSAKNSLDEEMGKRLVSVAKGLAYQIKPYQVETLRAFDESTQTFSVLRERALRLAAMNDLSSVYIFDASNRNLLDSNFNLALGEEYIKHQLHQSEIERAFGGQATPGILFKSNSGQFYKSAYAPIVKDGKAIAMVGVEANAEFFENLQHLKSGLTYFALACLIVIVLVSLIISSNIVRPVEMLVEHAKEMGEGQNQNPIDLKTDNEIGYLGQTLDAARKKIQSRDQEMQMMLHGIAHEIRNPLGGMELFVGLLMDENPEGDAKNYIEKIRDELANLKRVVNEFLDYAKGPVIECRPVNLNDFLQEVEWNFAQHVEDKKIDFKIEGENAGEWKMDSYYMRRAMFNLVQNAIDSVEPEKGQVRVRLDQSSDEMNIFIDDNGVGIADKDMAHVFKPFYTTKSKGTGLGLAFSRRIVQAHGGDLRVTSEPGNQTSFQIQLPRKS